MSKDAVFLRRLKNKARKSPLVWRYYHNFKPWWRYHIKPENRLEGEAKRVLADLNRDGIAITTVEALLGPEGVACFEQVRAEIARHDQEQSQTIEKARAAAQDPDNEKAFNFSYIVGRGQVGWSNPLTQLALQKPVVNLANQYFGMLTRLRYCNVWRTFATDAPARDSQLWHRDRDDHLTFKMFTYLEDVDSGTGPFTYAKATHPKGAIKAEPRGTPERPGGPLRTTDEEMAEVTPQDHWHSAVGKAGTIIFADTRGYHCGGRAKTRDRLMHIAMFVSSATPGPANDHLSTQPPLPDDPELRFALTGQLP